MSTIGWISDEIFPCDLFGAMQFQISRQMRKQQNRYVRAIAPQREKGRGEIRAHIMAQIRVTDGRHINESIGSPMRKGVFLTLAPGRVGDFTEGDQAQWPISNLSLSFPNKNHFPANQAVI